MFRLAIIAAPLAGLAAAFAAASHASLWLTVLVFGLSAVCAVLPDSNIGLLVVVVLAWHWTGTVHDIHTPWVLVAAGAVATFHTAMAAATVAPPSAVWGREMTARWARRLGSLFLVIGVSWVTSLALGHIRLRGNGPLLGASLLAIAAIALLLRAASLGSLGPARRNLDANGDSTRTS